MAGAEAVQGVGSGVVKASKGIGEVIYNAGEKILIGVEGEAEKDEFRSPVRIVGGRFEDVDDDEDEDEKKDEDEDVGIEVWNLVDVLLAQWTTLSEEERGVGSPGAMYLNFLQANNNWKPRTVLMNHNNESLFYTLARQKRAKRKTFFRNGELNPGLLRTSFTAV
ncbi:hypothetical protein DL98DRAFT_510981 [Cadophora sp. DSE1049]|nr:hypothetical protein DL98DRAFT_510981 [Cadophora sp. DSE1049]